MTYKKSIPDIVYSRWKELNSEYNIEFSLDNDCIDFLKTNFNDSVVNAFKEMHSGPHKADLWRLCKLFINSGVYADVDLVPYINLNTLDKDVTFYSCMSIEGNSIFQAFMATFSKPRNPLFLQFLISLLINKPYLHKFNGNTYDMFECLKHNLNGIDILTETKYKIDEVKIHIHIGTSEYNTKNVNLYYFPDDISYEVKLINNSCEQFVFDIKDNMLSVTRTDESTGWNHNHECDICIKADENIFIFPEKTGPGNNWVTSYVTHNNNKILDSRDLNYHHNSGWQ
jgi:hypothetical protein